MGGLAVTVGFIIAGVRHVSSEPECSTAQTGATWRGITVGISTRNDVHILLGPPDKIDILSRNDDYFVLEPPGRDPDLTFLYGEQDKVTYIYEHTPHVLSDFTQLYGYPQYQMGAVRGYLYVYENYGIVVRTAFDRSFDSDAKPFSDNTLVLEATFERPRSFECMRRRDPRFFVATGNVTPEPFTLP
jgi:hypothetical protein